MVETARDLVIKQVNKTKAHFAVAVSLGPHVLGFARPEPDPYDPNNIVHSLKTRLGRKPLPASFKMRGFNRFVWSKLRKEFEPVPYGTDLSFDYWIENSQYPLWKKNQLRQTWERCAGQLQKKHLKVNGFGKHESYPCYKALRGIFSRTDTFKCYAGPICHAVEKIVFKHPAFIKHIPISKRPEYIHNLLGPGPYYCTDFTAFESQFIAAIQDACEHQLMKYMTKNLDDTKVKTICDTIRGKNRIGFRSGVHASIFGRRMSGEMTTSLSNGFTNYMLVSYIAYLKGGEIRGVFEGDDGLFTMTGATLVNEDFVGTGFNVELKVFDSISNSSFCGMFYHPDELQNVRDPLDVLLKFAYSRSQRIHSKRSKLDALLKAKAYSLLYELPACPIVTKFARHVIDELKGVVPVFDYSWWQLMLITRDKLNIYKDVFEPGPKTRNLVADNFNVSVEQQLELEKYLCRCDIRKPLDHPLLTHLYSNRDNSSALSDYYDRYAVVQDRTFRTL